MISLAGLLLFAGIANFALVTITVLHEPRVLMFHGSLAIAISGVVCCTAVSAGMVWWLLSMTTVVESFQLGTSRLYDSHLSFNFFYWTGILTWIIISLLTNQSIKSITSWLYKPNIIKQKLKNNQRLVVVNWRWRIKFSLWSTMKHSWSKMIWILNYLFSGCVDNPKYADICPSVATCGQFCSKNQVWAKKNCPKSCNMCPPGMFHTNSWILSGNTANFLHFFFIPAVFSLLNSN